jgi:hypothetical protein
MLLHSSSSVHVRSGWRSAIVYVATFGPDTGEAMGWRMSSRPRCRNDPLDGDNPDLAQGSDA